MKRVRRAVAARMHRGADGFASRATTRGAAALVFMAALCGCSRGPDTVEQQARKGDRDAQYALAQRDAETAPAQALVWLRKAAENDHPAAQHELAERLLFGDGLPADPQEAVRWIRRAAANGHDASALGMGRLQLGESGDPVEACAWLLCASQSSVAAVREDARSELEALRGTLSPGQMQQAEARAREIAAGIAGRSK